MNYYCCFCILSILDEGDIYISPNLHSKDQNELEIH